MTLHDIKTYTINFNTDLYQYFLAGSQAYSSSRFIVISQQRRVRPIRLLLSLPWFQCVGPARHF